MSHTFISIKEFARSALPRLVEQLAFPNLVYKDYSADFTAKHGDTVQVRKPVSLQAREFDAGAGVTNQDIAESAVDVTLDKIATVDVNIGALQGATNVDDLNRIFIEPAAVALAQKINSDGLNLYKDIYNFIGTAGTTPSTLASIAGARKALNKQKVPASGRVAVWDPDADAAFTALEAIVHADKSGSVQALRDGSIGRVMGIEHYMTQAVKSHQTGITAATAVKVNGAVTAGAVKLSIDGTSLTGKLVKGDLMQIDGKSYVVTEDSANAASNAIANVKVAPALDAIADNADVTLIASHVANLAFHPMAFAFVTRPLVAPAGAESYVTTYNGVSLRVVRDYDITHKCEVLSMDVLYGFKTLYPELACRVLG